MVAKLCAALLIALCVAPETAPFSTMGPADPVSASNTDVRILAGQVADTDEALTIERSDFLHQSRLCGLVVVACSPVAPAHARRINPFDAHSHTLDAPALRTILRI